MKTLLLCLLSLSIGLVVGFKVLNKPKIEIHEDKGCTLACVNLIKKVTLANADVIPFIKGDSLTALLSDNGTLLLFHDPGWKMIGPDGSTKIVLH